MLHGVGHMIAFPASSRCCASSQQTWATKLDAPDHPCGAASAPPRNWVRAGRLGGVLVVAGTAAFTALGGAVAGALRRRSGSLLASAGMHWATNGLGVLLGLMAWHLAR